MLLNTRCLLYPQYDVVRFFSTMRILCVRKDPVEISPLSWLQLSDLRVPHDEQLISPIQNYLGDTVQIPLHVLVEGS